MSGGFTSVEAAEGRSVTGRGATAQEAFEQAGLAVFALAVDPGSIDERDARAVRAHGAAPESLLVNWLNECLYVLDVEGFAARRIEFLVFTIEGAALGGEPLRLHSLLHGEDLDPARHVSRETVRTVASTGAALVPVSGGYEARVLVLTGEGPSASPK